MADAKWTLDHGNEFPFDEGVVEVDWAHRAARGIMADLTDRRGVKHELEDCDDEIKCEIVESIADIIREADKERPRP